MIKINKCNHTIFYSDMVVAEMIAFTNLLFFRSIYLFLEIKISSY